MCSLGKHFIETKYEHSQLVLFVRHLYNFYIQSWPCWHLYIITIFSSEMFAQTAAWQNS